MRILAFHVHRLGELRSEIRVRSELGEEGFGQGLGVGSGLWIRNNDLGVAAFGVRARERDGLLGGKAEGDEEGGIVDIYATGLPCVSTGFSSGKVKWSVSTLLS